MSQSFSAPEYHDLAVLKEVMKNNKPFPTATATTTTTDTETTPDIPTVIVTPPMERKASSASQQQQQQLQAKITALSRKSLGSKVLPSDNRLNLFDVFPISDDILTPTDVRVKPPPYTPPP